MSVLSPDQFHKKPTDGDTGMLPPHGGNVPGYDIRMDFSANLNPLGMPSEVRKAVEADADCWEHYPDPYCRKLCRAIAERICRRGMRSEMTECTPADTAAAKRSEAGGNVRADAADSLSERIVCGNGAADLIFRITAALRPRKALITAPAFSEYEKALRQCGSEISYYTMNPEKQFDMDEGILDAIGADTDLVLLCTPNNPTGRLIDPALSEKIALRCGKCGAALVCDECFLGFVPDAWSFSALRLNLPHVIVLSAFTKLFAMPGLRLGFCICGSVKTAAKIRNTGQFWSVSAPAQSAGLAAIRVPEETDYLVRTQELVSRERAFLTQALQEAGLQVIPGQANFLLCHSGTPLMGPLLEEGILIRDCANFRGLSEGWYRIAVRTHAENEALVQCIFRNRNRVQP